MKVALISKISKANAGKIRECGAEITKGYDAEVALIDGRFDNFRKYEKLKWIHTSFVGVDEIITDEMRNSNVIVTNSRGMLTPVPEHAVALVLAFDRKLYEAFDLQKKSEWKRLFEAGELAGKTIGILGLGAIGVEVARLFKSFNCRVIAINKEPVESKYVDSILPDDKLPALLKESDYVISCLPLTKETRHLLGEKEFAMMKRTSVVVNVGRGPVVDERALVAALKGKKIAGACLDVFETEPLPKSSPLWKMENVIITSHYASKTPHYEDRMIEIFCRNLVSFTKGEKLINVVDKKKGY